MQLRLNQDIEKEAASVGSVGLGMIPIAGPVRRWSEWTL